MERSSSKGDVDSTEIGRTIHFSVVDNPNYTHYIYNSSQHPSHERVCINWVLYDDPESRVGVGQPVEDMVTQGRHKIFLWILDRGRIGPGRRFVEIGADIRLIKENTEFWKGYYNRETWYIYIHRLESNTTDNSIRFTQPNRP